MTRQRDADVTIVIPHHKGPDLLRECLGSLRELRYKTGRWKVCVVADASTDDSVEVLRREFPDVAVLENETNLGFAGTCNRGAREAETGWVAFLNNDTQVDPDWLTALFSAVKPTAGVMAAASKILNWEGRAVTFQGGYLNFVGKGFEEACARGSAGERTEARDILFASGCSMLAHRETFLTLGGFDSQFFGFYEDTDFGWRMRLAGYRTRLAADSMVRHRGHASFDAAGKQRRLAYLERNAFWQIMKNLGDDTLNRILPAALFLAVKRSEILEGGFVHGRRKQVGDAVQALLQGGPLEGLGKMTLSACAGMLDGLPDLMRKRSEIQRGRKIPDTEILTKEFFPDPFKIWSLDAEMQSVLAKGGYASVVRNVIEAFGIREIFPYAVVPSG